MGFEKNLVIRLKWLCLALMIWSGVSFVSAYGKQWIGNSQEIYPSFIYPAFLRNKDKVSLYQYPNYQLIVFKDGKRTIVEPVKLFGRHWIKKAEKILENKAIHPLAIDHLTGEWNKYDKILLVKNVKQFQSQHAMKDHSILKSDTIIYALKKG